jgi:porin
MSVFLVPRGFCSRFQKLAAASGFALILAMSAVPASALTGSEPVTVDPAVVVAADTPASTYSEEAPKFVGPEFLHQSYMFNWGKERSAWAEQGFSFNFHYVTDALGDPNAPKGDVERFSNWERLRGTVNVDFGKFSGLKGLSFMATGLWQNGVNVGAEIGTIANPSGIVSSHQFRLDSINLTQKFAHDKVQLTAGIMAAQDYYGLQTYIGSFISEPLFYNFGNMFNARTSYDPESGPGVNLKIIPEKHFFLQTGYFLPPDDGEAHAYPTGFNYRNGSHGATSDTAVGFYTDPSAPSTRKAYPGTYQLGFSYNGSKAGSFNPIMGYSGFFDYSKGKYVNGNYSVYFQANQSVYRLAAGSNRGLDVAFGVNSGPQNKSKVPTEYTSGLIFRGPIACRSKDSLALGLVYSKIGNGFNTYQQQLGNPTLNNETLIELNYKIQIAPWLVLQPVYDHYSSVGGSNNSGTIAGFRLETQI